MKILRAAAGQAETIAPLFDAYRAFYGQKPSGELARRFLESRLLLGESIVFYAVDDVGVAGFAQLYPLFSSVGLSRIWLLNDLFVTPRRRGAGFGKALLDRVKEYAVETGASTLFLQTGVDNHAAQALYESRGYVRDEQFYRYDLTLGSL